MLDNLSTRDWFRFFLQAAHYMSRATEAIDGPCNDCDDAGSAIETGGAAGDISIGAITKALAKKLRNMKQVPTSAGPYVDEHLFQLEVCNCANMCACMFIYTSQYNVTLHLHRCPFSWCLFLYDAHTHRVTHVIRSEIPAGSNTTSIQLESFCTLYRLTVVKSLLSLRYMSAYTTHNFNFIAIPLTEQNRGDLINSLKYIR